MGGGGGGPDPLADLGLGDQIRGITGSGFLWVPRPGGGGGGKGGGGGGRKVPAAYSSKST